jgi:hypothetical protein
MTRPADRMFSRCLAEQPAPDAKVEERLVREAAVRSRCVDRRGRDRAGRHFLDQVVAGTDTRPSDHKKDPSS